MTPDNKHAQQFRTSAQIQESRVTGRIINQAINANFKKAEEIGGFSPDQLRILYELQENIINLVVDISKYL